MENASSTTTDHPNYFNVTMPLWEATITGVILGIIVIITIVGNIFVILSVFTYKPLKTPQNLFIVSLAVADLTVALIVLPLNIAFSVMGEWKFGPILCKIWLTSDILCCTASILNLCAIALDRYWAISDPLNYAIQRTSKRVLLMVFGVWLISAAISSPPLLGWNDWPVGFNYTDCALSQDEGYVIYSSLGSFYIPLLIMTTIYIEIFFAARRRLRDRARAANCNFLTESQKRRKGGKALPIEGREGLTSKNSRQSVGIQNNSAPNGPRVSLDDNNFSGRNNIEIQIAEDSTSNDKKVPPEQIGSPDCDTPTTWTFRSIFGTSLLSRTFSWTSSGSNVPETCVEACPEGSVEVRKVAEKRKRISLSKERRAAKTLGVIMGAFIICWLPFSLMYVIRPFCKGQTPPPKLINFITWLGYVNSSLNPFIYTIFNIEFRRAFKKLLRMK